MNRKFSKSHLTNILESAGFQGQKVPNIKLEFSNVEEFQIGSKYAYSIPEDSKYRKAHLLLNKWLNSVLITSQAPTAYLKGKSYFNFFEPHIHGSNFLKLDIKNFFPSIDSKLIKQSMITYFEDEIIDEESHNTLIDIFTNLVTLDIPLRSQNEKFRKKNILPIGLTCSPVISNFVFRELDILIENYCFSKEITYSRYADDLLFSTTRSDYLFSESFLKEIKILLYSKKFVLNLKKTLKKKKSISINGYVIDNESLGGIGELRLSKRKLYSMEKAIHQMNAGKSPSSILKKVFGKRIKHATSPYPIVSPEFVDQYFRDSLLNVLRGNRSFLIAAHNFGQKYSCTGNTTLGKYASIIEKIDRILNSIANR